MSVPECSEAVASWTGAPIANLPLFIQLAAAYPDCRPAIDARATDFYLVGQAGLLFLMTMNTTIAIAASEQAIDRAG